MKQHCQSDLTPVTVLCQGGYIQVFIYRISTVPIKSVTDWSRTLGQDIRFAEGEDRWKAPLKVT